MTTRTSIILIGATSLIMLYVLAARMWDPMRWGMYINALRETAPIEFYGRVTDEDGQGLAGVRIHAVVSKPNLMFILGAEKTLCDVHYEVITDADGSFVIEDEGVLVLITDFRLASYEFQRRVGDRRQRTLFYYAGAGASAGNAHHPDPNDPVIFEMERKR